MKNTGYRIENKILNIPLLVEIADKRKMSLEDLSIMIGCSRPYLRNRKNEIKRGLYRECCSEIVKAAMKVLDLSYDDLVIDIPKR